MQHENPNDKFNESHKPKNFNLKNEQEDNQMYTYKPVSR